MLRDGMKVRAVTTAKKSGQIQRLADYLAEVGGYLEVRRTDWGLRLAGVEQSQDVKRSTAIMDSDVRTYGTVVILDNARLEKGRLSWTDCGRAKCYHREKLPSRKQHIVGCGCGRR